MNRGEDTYTILKEIGLSLLAEGKTIRAKAEGYSMYPFIKPGSIVLLGPVNDSITLIPGEIIAWKRDSGFVLHRLTGIIKNGNEIHFITRGDSCLQEDQPLSREQIAGRVILIEDANGKIREASQLIAKPRYFFNRLIIWFFFKWKRVSNLVMRIFKSDERKG
jgi:signal peptidase I